jgi:hypothetical protein
VLLGQLLVFEISCLRTLPYGDSKTDSSLIITVYVVPLEAPMTYADLRDFSVHTSFL